jgi:heme exporter protein C
MDNTMRIVFYPAVIGWILIGAWITSIKIRIKNIDDTQKYA